MNIAKRLVRYAVAGMIVTLACAPMPASAQESKKAIRPHPGGLVEANWLIGEHLHDADGKDLGKISELWVDPKNGQVKEVIVSAGSTLGLHGKDKVISWNDLKIAWKDQKLFVSAEPGALRDFTQANKERDERSPAASPSTAAPKR